MLVQDVGGGAVLLDLASEQCLGLDPVGTRIWALLDGNASLGAVNGNLCDEYDAEAGRIGEDLLDAGWSSLTWRDDCATGVLYH